MAAQHYSQYFNIDEKYYAVVTKDLIDKGEVKWEGFFPHETFIQLLHQTVDMLSGKENKSIWVEGSYGTGKSHASLTLKCLLEASDEQVRAYFEDYGLSADLCNKFLTARSAEMHGRLVVVHRIGSSNVKNDDDLVWAIQNSVQEALTAAGITNQAEGTLKDALLKWVNDVSFAKAVLDDILSKHRYDFNNMSATQLIATLMDDDDYLTEQIMTKLIPLCKQNGISCLNMDSEMLAKWLENVIIANDLGGIVFIWDEFSEFFKNCQNSLTGFQTLAQVSHSVPFYFVIVTHESDSLIANASDRSKISNRFIEPRVHIELPDNMAFRLMAQAMKETDDPVMSAEWKKIKPSLNGRLATVRNKITTGVKKHAKAGAKTQLSDEQLQEIVPLHPYAALILKHISRVFTASQRSMFDFIVARDPDADNGHSEDGSLVCRGFKWFINHHGALQHDNLMTVDMLWDFFNIKAGGNMNPDALAILSNFDTLSSEYKLNSDEQRVLKTVLLMNAICTRVMEADMLVPTYENIDLAFLGTSWPTGKAANIARALVHRAPPLHPVLFEEPMEDGVTMRVIPIQKGTVDGIEPIKDRIRSQTTVRTLIDNSSLAEKFKLPPEIAVHITLSYAYVNPQNTLIFTNSIKEAKNRAYANPDFFELVLVLALTDAERAEANRAIQGLLKSGIPNNLLVLDGTTNTFGTYLDNYITNTAYSEYYLKSDKKMSVQFGSYAKKNLSNWADQLLGGQFRLFDMQHPNGQMRTTFEAMLDLIREINTHKYPFGIEQYHVLPAMFTRSSFGLGAECGLTETEKNVFSSGNPKTKLSLALAGAWKETGRYWENAANQGLVIARIKAKVEEVIAAGFAKNGRVDIVDIVSELQNPPFGLTATNLAAFILGFVLKEYASDQYFWSNGTTRPMSIELMKGAIKNALDQSVNPKPNYRNEAIVLMSEKMRLFLNGTATIFHESLEHCGSVDAAAGIIRVGMKRLDFPIWCVKSLLDKEALKTDIGVVAEVIDKYLGIANIKNYHEKTTESDLATEIGDAMAQYPSLVDDLSYLLVSTKCREGMKVYLEQYRDGELPHLATIIKDNGAFIAEVKKKFNADEANWVWSAETANVKIDEVILEYGIIAESNTIVAPAMSVAGCVRNWKDRMSNFRISYEAMESELGDLRELMEILCEIKKSSNMTFPETKKARFLELLRSQRDAFKYLYGHQLEMFCKIAEGWLSELNGDADAEELFHKYMETGVYTDASDKYFKSVEAKVKAFLDDSRKKRLEKLWLEKTNTTSPREWSRRHVTPILCMFSDNERVEAKTVFEVFTKPTPSQAEFEHAMNYLWNATFYDRLDSEEERNRCMVSRVIGDYIYMVSSISEVRDYLCNHASMIHPYDWMDNSSIRNKIEQLADKHYKTGGAMEAQNAIADLDVDEVRAYLKDLIKTNMTVGIAILKKKPQ